MRDLDSMSEGMRPNTAFLLMAQYNGAAIVPLEFVCRDYFRHLTVNKLLRKVLAGQIKLPIIRIEDSQKPQKAFISPTLPTTSTSSVRRLSGNLDS